MSLQAIAEKIKADALVEVGSIIADAELSVAEITQETNRQINDIKLAFTLSLEKQKSQLEVVHRSLEKQRINLAKQSIRRFLLDEVYAQALNEILLLSSAEYVEMLVKKYKSLVTDDIKISSILAPESRLSEITEVSKLLGWSASIEITNRFKGGCILVGSDFEFDLSIERLFAEQRSESEIEIAATLFNKAVV